MRRVRKIVKLTFWAACGLLSVAILLGVGLAVRLALGPLETSVPQSLLDRVVAEAAPGWRIEASGAELDFSSDDELSGLKLHDVVLSDASGHQIVSAPALGLRFALSASLNPAEALTIREVVLSGASVEVIRDENGTFQLALGDIASNDGSDDPFASLSELGSLTDLPQLRIEDAQVQYSDLARGTSWRTEKAQLILSPTQTGLAGSLGVIVDGGIGGAQIDAFYSLDTGDVGATLTLSEVRPSRIAGLDPIFAPLVRIDAPLSGTVSLAADDGGTFREVSARLRASQGYITLDDTPIAMESVDASVSCDIPQRSCAINDLSITSTAFSGTTTGSVSLYEPDIFSFNLTVDDANLRQAEMLLAIDQAKLSGSFDASERLATIHGAAFESVSANGLQDGMTANVGALTATGTVDLNTLNIALPEVSAAAIKVVNSEGTSQALASLTTSLTINIEAGTLDVAGLEAVDLALFSDDLTIGISELKGDASFDRADARIDVGSLVASKMRIDREETKPSWIASAALEGSIDLTALAFKNGQIRLDNATLSLPEFYAAPVLLDRAKISLAAARDKGVTRIDLTKSSATINGLAATAKGKFALRATGTVFGNVEATFGAIDMAAVRKHWPIGIAPGGLSWISDNVRSGIVSSVTAKASFDEVRPANDTLDLRFGFKDALASFAPNMPPIKGAAGTGKVTLDRLDISLSAGHIDAQKAGSLALKGSSFSIADFSPDVPEGDVKLRAAGTLQSVLRLLDSEPLNVISPTGFDISTAEGQADVRVVLQLPLTDDLQIEDVSFDARAKIHKYDLIEPETGLPVSGDLLQVKATPDGLTLQSDARIGGLAARLGYSLGFNEPEDGAPESVLTLESFLSLADFARHGLELDDYVEGQTGMKARVEMFEGGASRINADADLTNLTLKADQVGWSKPAGVPATVRLSGFRNPNGAGRIQALSLRGEGISAEGSIGFDRDGQITRANFSRIVLGSAVDTGLVFGRKTNGDVGILVKGARLDLRHSFAAALEGESTPDRKPANPSATDISVQVGRVVLRDDLAIFDLNGGVRLRGGDLHAANVSGKLNGSAATKILAERRAEGMAIRLTAPDAGAFIRATDVFVGAYDGALVLNAIRRDSVSPAQISGNVLVTDMVVHDAPTLGRILSGGAIGSLMSDLANGGIRFSKINLPFRGLGSRWNIRDGVGVRSSDWPDA